MRLWLSVVRPQRLKLQSKPSINGNGSTLSLVRHNQFDVEGLQSLYRYVQTDVGLKFEKLFRRSERTLDAAAEAARTQPYEEGPVLDLEEVQLDNILKTLAELDAEVKRAL